MPYRPVRSRSFARLRSCEQLEDAMQRRDFDGTELATQAGTSRQIISRLRTAAGPNVQPDTARKIERALHMSDGALFAYPAAEKVAS